jgi:AcrR family transcriptional regulator
MAKFKRVTQMRREERRKQLLEVARDIIDSEGLGALTMARLAERANIAKPVVYTHFADRNAVAIALLDKHAKAIRAFFEARISKATTLGGYVASVVDASFAFETVSDVPVRKITNGFVAGDEVNQVFLTDEIEFREHWQRLFSLLAVPKDRAEILAPIFIGMVGSAVVAFANAEQEDLAKDTLTTLLLNALNEFRPGHQSSAADVPDFNGPVSEAIAQVYNAKSAKPPPNQQD